MRAYLIAIALVVTACGDDGGGGTPPKPPTPGGPAKPGAKTAGKTKELKPMRRIEDRVSCPTPSDAKKCDPKAPLCGAHQYCLAAAKEFYCGPCPERDSIRHEFKPRDFAGPELRDPFYSFLLSPGTLGPNPGDQKGVEPTPKCTRKDQFQASSWNYQQLKLTGILTQGTQRKALLMGGNMGYILKKGDCVGKEKAVVKDIGAAFITFANDSAGKNDPVEYSMQLYPTIAALGPPDALDPGAASTPIVAPPSQVTAPPSTAPTGPQMTGPQTTGPQTTTTIIQDKPATTTIPAPSQAPTQLKP